MPKLDSNGVLLLVLLVWLVANLVVFALYGIDKYKAKHKKWRIPEATLIGAAVFGVFGCAAWHVFLSPQDEEAEVLHNGASYSCGGSCCCSSFAVKAVRLHSFLLRGDALPFFIGADEMAAVKEAGF